MIKKLILPVLGVGALLTAAAIPLVASAVKSGAVEVYLLLPHQDKGTIEVNEFMFDAKPDDPDYDKKLMQVYGVPTEKKEAVIVDKSKLVAAKQKPSLVWLPVDKTKGENPLQAKTVDFVAKLAAGGAVQVGALFLILALLFACATPAPPARSPAAGH